MKHSGISIHDVRFKAIVLLLILIGIILSCREEILSVPLFPTNRKTLKNVKITQFAYDSLRFENAPSLFLSKRNISKITILEWLKDNYKEMQSITPEYMLWDGKYIPRFSVSVKVPEDLLMFKGRIKFTLTDSSFIDLDTTFVLCKYPYESAEVFLLRDDLPYPDITVWYIDDFDFENQSLFYRSAGGYGIYEVNLLTGQSKIWVDYVSHNLIAIDRNHLFFTIAENEIAYMNLISGESKFFKKFADNTSLTGLEARDSNLYALDYHNWLIYHLDYRANILDTIKIGVPGVALTTYKEFLIFIGNRSLKAYDLKSKRVLTLNPLAPQSYAIRVWGNYLYFYDDDRGFIGSVPLQDILELDE